MRHRCGAHCWKTKDKPKELLKLYWMQTPFGNTMSVKNQSPQPSSSKRTCCRRCSNCSTKFSVQYAGSGPTTATFSRSSWVRFVKVIYMSSQVEIGDSCQWDCTLYRATSLVLA